MHPVQSALSPGTRPAGFPVLIRLFCWGAIAATALAFLPTSASAQPETPSLERRSGRGEGRRPGGGTGRKRPAASPDAPTSAALELPPSSSSTLPLPPASSSTLPLPPTAGSVADLPPALVAAPLTTSPLESTPLSMSPFDPLEGQTSSAELMGRLDDILADVGWTTAGVDLDAASVQDTSASALLHAGMLLPESPLPLEELDRLTSTSRGASRLTLMEAICRALESNQELRVERLRPESSNTGIESALSEFDTTLRTSGGFSETRSSTLGARARGGVDNRDEGTRISRSRDFDVSLSGRLPTGTEYDLSYSANRSINNLSEAFYSSALNLNITQNLLRGAGCEVNLVRVRTAQNNFVRSLYTLQQFLNNLVTNVQSQYFDLYLAVETLRIRRQAYDVARLQRQQVGAFVEVGRAAPLDAFAAQAEEASRVSGVINAAADLRQQQLELARLMNPLCLPEGWRTRLFPSEPPIVPQEALIPEKHVQLAQRYRPDLRQAEIDLANGDLELLRTENGLLPVLDFVTQVGSTGVGDAFATANEKTLGGDFPNYRVGFEFAYPLQNRAARAAYRQAAYDRQQSQEAISNLQQVIQLDVRAALIDVERTGRLIESTSVTRRLRELEFAAEQEKFRVGRSTQILVNQALRDLTAAQLDEVTARVAHMKSYLELYRADGTVLLRRGIQPIHISPTSGVPSN